MTKPDKPDFHMTAEEFRRHGHAVVDWIADYHERVESLPVRSQVSPGDIRAMLPDRPPTHGEPFATILEDVERVLLPGITHWQSPNFFAYFPANISGPSVLGELLSAGLGVQGMLWTTSPACTELETHVLDWMVDMMGLPASFKSTGEGGGVIQDTASSAGLCALLAARERATGLATNERGVVGGKLIVYLSSQSHSSLEKAVKIAGLGAAHIRLIDVDERMAMKPDALAAQLDEDRAAGRIPCFVSATVGTTSSHAMDPIRAIADVCQQRGVWLHVDAAMAGTAAVCPEFRHLLDGLEGADSYCFNPHKWMFTNFDCNLLFVRERAALINALSILPEYLRNQATHSGSVIDYRDWQVPLGRRFRALKLWFVIRHYGVEGLRHHIREHVRLTQELATWIARDASFEIAAPVPLNLVCFRHKQGDAVNQALLDTLNDSGALYLSHTRLDGKLTLRLCVGQSHTQAHHVERAWQLITSTADKILSS